MGSFVRQLYHENGEKKGPWMKRLEADKDEITHVTVFGISGG